MPAEIRVLRRRRHRRRRLRRPGSRYSCENPAPASFSSTPMAPPTPAQAPAANRASSAWAMARRNLHALVPPRPPTLARTFRRSRPPRTFPTHRRPLDRRRIAPANPTPATPSRPSHIFASHSKNYPTSDLRHRYPQIAVDDTSYGILEPASGVLMARRAVQTVVDQAQKIGVDLPNRRRSIPQSHPSALRGKLPKSQP